MRKLFVGLVGLVIVGWGQPSPMILQNGWLAGTIVPNSCSSGNSPTFYSSTNVLYDCLGGVYVARTNGLLGPTFTNPYTKWTWTRTPPNFTTLATLYNNTQFDIGGFPDNLQFGFTANQNVQSLVGSVNVTSGGIGAGFSDGGARYARTTQQGKDSVGVYGGGYCAGPFTQCWGANFTVAHDINTGGSNEVGVEIDTNHSASGGDKAAIILGTSVVANHVTAPSGYAHGYDITLAATSNYGYNIGFNSNSGAANIGLSMGTVSGSGTTSAANSQSQFIQQVSTSAGGAAQVYQGWVSTDNTYWQRMTGGGFVRDVSGTSAIYEGVDSKGHLFVRAPVPTVT